MTRREFLRLVGLGLATVAWRPRIQAPAPTRGGGLRIPFGIPSALKRSIYLPLITGPRGGVWIHGG